MLSWLLCHVHLFTLYITSEKNIVLIEIPRVLSCHGFYAMFTWSLCTLFQKNIVLIEMAELKNIVLIEMAELPSFRTLPQRMNGEF